MMVKFKKWFYLLIIFLYSPLAVFAFDSFDCVGADPFWKLSLADQKFTFMQKNAPDVTMPNVEPKSAENMSVEHIRVFRTTLNDKEAIIIIQKQSCTDGKSEEMFAYEGLFITSDKVFHGCCGKKMLLTH